MSAAIRESITKAFGFEPVCINSALVSAQNRQRLYWVGKRNEDGTYSKVDVTQPEDRGILLRDILESGYDLTGNDKAYTQTASYNGAVAWNTIERHQRNMVAVPVSVRLRGRDGIAKYEARDDEKNGVITANTVGITIAEPVGIIKDGKSYCTPVCHTIPQEVRVRKFSCDIEKFQAILRQGKQKSKRTNAQIAEKLDKPHTEVEHWFRTDKYFNIPDENVWFDLKELLQIETTEFDDFVTVFEERDGIFEKANRCYDVNGKMSTLLTGQTDNIIAPICYALASEWDDLGKPTKAVSYADNKIYDVYEVKDSQITIRGKKYSIKLSDGYYIIRKLTVRECMRLQTVPEWYEFPVSDAQAYKLLGNGWTVEVIVHILSCIFDAAK